MEHNAEDTNDKGISTLQTLSKENTEKIPLEGKEKNSATKRKEKKKDRKALNYLRKNNTQFDIKMNNRKDKTHTSQLDNNEDCNDILSKTDLSIIGTVEHGSTADAKNKATFTLENSRYTFFNIDYKFHEANHAIIDTFAVNIYFSQCTDNKKTYCLVCNTTFQIQDIPQKHLYNHIKSNMHIQLLSQMIKDDKKSIKGGKVFSKLGLARECMRSRNDIIECLLCDNKNLSSEIQNNDQSIYEHITSSEHQNSKVTWAISVQNVLRDVHNCFRSKYNARNYRCEFCNYEGSSEIYFLKHLRVPYHTTRLTEFPDYAEIFKFHFCATCLILWFGSLETYDLHCEQIEHKRKIKYGSDLDYLPEKVIQFLIELNHNAEALLERSNSVRYNETINYVLYNLVNDLQIYIPNVKAYPFGSRISELGFPDSDIDIFLDCDNMYEGRNSTHSHCRNLVTLVVYYLSLNKIWKVQNVILHSRTPIAKVLHIPSGLVCDISVTNGLAVENSKLIKCFNRAFPLCRKMVLFLKQWLHFCGLLGSHIITSYALTWFVIFYLQTLLVFPSISELIKLRNCSWRISGWEVGVSYDFPVRRIDHTFEELLLGFFMFYADFKYKIHVVCPLLGRPIEKDAFNFTNLSSLPQNMEPYVTYMRNVNTPEKPQAFTLSPLCVQDPFDLSHNLTKAVYSGKLSKFQSKCVYSIRILMKTFPYLKSPCCLI